MGFFVCLFFVCLVVVVVAWVFLFVCFLFVWVLLLFYCRGVSLFGLEWYFVLLLLLLLLLLSVFLSFSSFCFRCIVGGGGSYKDNSRIPYKSHKEPN